MIQQHLNPYHMTDREQDIMHILWNSDTSLTASEICQAEDRLSLNTVQATLKKLLKREYIQIDKIVYSNTVLCRSYTAAISATEWNRDRFIHDIRFWKTADLTVPSFITALLEAEKDSEHFTDELDELEAVLARMRSELDDRNKQKAEG